MTAKPVPPIPPGCEYFKPYSIAGTICFVPDAAKTKCIPLSMHRPLNDSERGIIAAVAECAWLREAERVPSPVMKYGMHPDNLKKYTAARDNAAAWRSWSRAEQDTGGARA